MTNQKRANPSKPTKRISKDAESCIILTFMPSQPVVATSHIEQLKLSKSAYNLLISADKYLTINQLTQLTEEDLRKVKIPSLSRHPGKRFINEIREELLRHGFYLKGEGPNPQKLSAALNQ